MAPLLALALAVAVAAAGGHLLHQDAEAYAFGSGHYGEWRADRSGSPAFHFTGRPLGALPHHAVAPPTWPSIFHRVGNDRLNGVALTDGSLIFKHDENVPTLDGIGSFIGNSRPYTGTGFNVSGGGFGWAVDAATDAVVAMTRQDRAVNASSALKLSFGVGYAQKNTTGAGIAVSQTVHAPFGADPVLVSTVTLTNQRSANATIRWMDVWPGRTVLMNKGHGTPNCVRRALSRKLLLGGGGDEAYAIVATADPVNTSATPNIPPSYPVAQARWQDGAPLPLFLAAVGASAVTGSTTSASELWGSPHSINSPNPKLSKPSSAASSWDQTGQSGVFAIERTVQLQPDESVELRSVFGVSTQAIILGSIMRRKLVLKDCL